MVQWQLTKEIELSLKMARKLFAIRIVGLLLPFFYIGLYIKYFINK